MNGAEGLLLQSPCRTARKINSWSFLSSEKHLRGLEWMPCVVCVWMGKVFNRMFVIFGVFQYFGIQLNRLRSRLKHIPGKARRRRRRWRGKWRRSGKTISFFSPKDYDPKEDNFSKWTFCHVLNYHSTFSPLVLSRKRQTHSGNLSVNLCERILLFRRYEYALVLQKDVKYINVIVAALKHF